MPPSQPIVLPKVTWVGRSGCVAYAEEGREIWRSVKVTECSRNKVSGGEVVIMLIRHLVVWDPIRWEELVGPMVVHLFREAIEDRSGLHVQVTEHRGAVPAAKELDGVAVHPSA